MQNSPRLGGEGLGHPLNREGSSHDRPRRRDGPRTATAFARYVRHNPLSGMAVVKATTVQSYITSIARHLITQFPADNLVDWRLIPNSPYRDTM